MESIELDFNYSLIQVLQRSYSEASISKKTHGCHFYTSQFESKCLADSDDDICYVSLNVYRNLLFHEILAQSVVMKGKIHSGKSSARNLVLQTLLSQSKLSGDPFIALKAFELFSTAFDSRGYQIVKSSNLVSLFFDSQSRARFVDIRSIFFESTIVCCLRVIFLSCECKNTRFT